MSFRLIPLIRGSAPLIVLQRPVLLIGRHLECDVRINSPKISRRHCCLAMAYDRAGEAYEPQFYEGKVLQISAGRTPLGLRPDPTLGWSEFLTGEVTARTVPGFRQNLLDEPAVEVLTSLIREAIGECVSAEPGDLAHEISPRAAVAVKNAYL